MGWQEAIATTVAGLGYELVDVERAQRGLLRITIDRIPGRSYRAGRGADAPLDAGEAVTVDDCEAVTRQLQYVLEVEGLDYARLEVSSPGLDRPLKRESDYLRFAGQRVRIALKAPFEGRKVWEGVLSRGEAEGWNLSFTNGKTEQVLGFALHEVRDARLVPVVDFKGRKTGALPAGGADGASASAAPATDPVAAAAARG
jgi:ribosome maturation factor RimP